MFGPWLAHVGRNGFAPTGEKREGDGRTPSGAYGLSFFFGVRGNPGVKFPYRDVTGPWIVWDDDSSSANYNLWIDTRTDSAGANPEPMHVPGVYDYGAVIAYNTARAPGLGSAIFLHVSSGGSTAGCVSLPTVGAVGRAALARPGSRTAHHHGNDGRDHVVSGAAALLDLRQCPRDTRTLVRSEVPPEVLLDRGAVHRVGARVGAAPESRRSRRSRRGRSAGSVRRSTRPSASMRCTNRLKPGWL